MTTPPVPAPIQNGGRYRALVDTETVLVGLLRKTGEQVAALPGEVLDLFEGHELTGRESDAEKADRERLNTEHAQTIGNLIDQGKLEAADGAEVDPWPREQPVEVDTVKVAAEADLADKVRTEEAAAQLKAQQDAAAAQQRLAAAAGTDTPTDPENAPTA